MTIKRISKKRYPLSSINISSYIRPMIMNEGHYVKNLFYNSINTYHHHELLLENISCTKNFYYISSCISTLKDMGYCIDDIETETNDRAN